MNVLIYRAQRHHYCMAGNAGLEKEKKKKKRCAYAMLAHHVYSRQGMAMTRLWLHLLKARGKDFIFPLYSVPEVHSRWVTEVTATHN